MEIKAKKSDWNLSLLFDSDNDPKIEEEKKKIESESYRFINKWKERSDYLTDPKALKEALDEYEKLEDIKGDWAGKAGYYFWLRSNLDKESTAIKAKSSKMNDFSNKIENDLRFFDLKLSKVDENKQKEFLESDLLKDYHHFLKRSFEVGKYDLSEKEEIICSLKETNSHTRWVEMLDEFLSKEERLVLNEKGKKVKKNFSEIMETLNHSKKKVRDSAAKEFNDILSKWSDVAEYEINAVLHDKKIDDELRKTSRPDLFRHLNDDIESEVVDVLIKTVSDNFDIPKRFYKLKAQLLGLKKLQYHERNVSCGETKKEYDFESGVTLINDVFSSMDPEFVKIFKEYIETGKVDVYPKKGKTSGGFCVTIARSLPTYILLNYANRLEDVTVMAHEFGHAINAELSKKNQNAFNFENPFSTAEVASTFMEDFVFEKILEKADDKTKFILIMDKLGNEISTIFRQTACYRFEQELHKEYREKGHLSKEEIGSLFSKHMFSYMGDYVEQSPGSENWWIYWSHIRRFFYVYSYSSGLLISKAMQRKFREDKSFIKKVKEFLSAGSSDSPKNIFLNLGIDISKKSFWEQGISEVSTLLDEAESLAKKLKKIK